MHFTAQHINLLFFTLALIVENDFDCAKELVNQKDLTNTIVQLMQVSEDKDRDRNYKKRLVKGASILVASLTSVRDADIGMLDLKQTPNYIQEKIGDHSSLVGNFCLNLNHKDHNNVKCMIQAVGNLAVLKEIKSNQFLLKVGLQKIIDKFLGNNLSGGKRMAIKPKHIQLMVQAARTIYLLAKTQDKHLIKRLYDLKIIDIAIESYEKYAIQQIKGTQTEGLARDGKAENEARCEMLLFYCKLILLEMSHDSLWQQEIIHQNGVHILETLEQFGTKKTISFYKTYLNRHKDQFLSEKI